MRSLSSLSWSRAWVTAFVALPCASSVGCEAPAEIRYETEHLRIGATFDEPLCRGDLDRWESLVTSLQGDLGTQLSAPVEVYVWDFEEWDGEHQCGYQAYQGCYEARRHGVIYGTLTAIDHELIHAVMATFDEPDSLFDEGAAEAFAPDQRTLFGQTDPAASLGLTGHQVSYLTAGHFVRWLWETQGPGPFRELLARSGDGPRAAFERAYGLSIDDAQEQYYDEAPWSYAPRTTCAHPTLVQLDPGYWSERLDLDCEAEHVRGGPYGMSTRRVVEISARAHYALSTSAEGLAISRCMDEHVWEAPEPQELEDGDVPPAYASWPSNYTRGLPGDGAVTVLELAPGRYELAVNIAGHETTGVDLALWTHVGPVPQLPESSE